MLTEEGHHMFVGKSGVERIVDRTCTVMNEQGITDPDDVGRVRVLDVIDLPLIQRKLNFHYSVTLDLFGSEISTNAANAFNAGIKGRLYETDIDDDHQLHDDTYPVPIYRDGRFQIEDRPAISAINARLLDDYINECDGVVAAWNKVIRAHGIDFELVLPHRAFNRRQGGFKGMSVSPNAWKNTLRSSSSRSRNSARSISRNASRLACARWWVIPSNGNDRRLDGAAK